MAAVRNRPNWVFVSRFHTVFVANKMGYTSVMQDVVQDCRLRHQVLIFPMAIAWMIVAWRAAAHLWGICRRHPAGNQDKFPGICAIRG